MTITYPPDPVELLLEQALATWRTALEATDAGAPDRVFIAHGEVAYDCAQAWVRAAAVYPSRAGVGADDEARRRSVPLQLTVNLELGVLRCVSTVRTVANKPTIPGGDTITTEAVRNLRDAQAMRAVRVLWPQTGIVAARNLATGGWTPISNQGGLAGGLFVYNVPIADCAPTVQ